MRLLKHILVAFLLHVLYASYGQEVSAFHYSVRDGLPSSVTYSMAQDDQGFVWIGTEAGLVRFDGVKFKVYTTLQGLPDNEVLAVFFDKDTRKLWVVTYSKAACYYRDGQIYTTANDSSLAAIKCEFGEFMNANMALGRGLFLFNTSDIYECVADSVRHYHMIPHGILQVQRTSDSTLDLLTSFGCLRRSDRDGQLRLAAFDSSVFWNNGKWIGNRLFRFMPHQVEVYYRDSANKYVQSKPILLPTEAIPGNVISQGARFYVSATNTGVYMLDTALSSIPRRIWSGHANNIGVDRNGNLYILTSDDGLYIIKNTDLGAQNISSLLKSSSITALSVFARDTILIGTSEGDVYWQHGTGPLHKWNIAGSSTPERIRRLVRFQDHIYCITSGKIFRYDIHSGQTTYFHHSSGGPKSLLPIRERNVVLVGLLSCILTIDAGTGAMAEDNTELRRYIDMVRHPDGRVFFASIDGVYEFTDPAHVSRITQDQRLRGRVSTLCFTSDSLLWIGTPATGVMVYDGHKILAHISSEIYAGYNGTICRRIVQGRAGEVWVATNFGVNKITYHYHGDSLAVTDITPFNTTDGLLSDDINDVLVRDSLVYIGTAAGLSVLNAQYTMTALQVPVYISSVRIHDEDSTIHESMYDLRHDQNDLKIEYVAVALPSAADLRYQYRLLGSGNEAWTTTTNRSVDFRSLSPGTYQFEVAVLDKYGNRSASVARIHFRIRPAFYTTVWFWATIMISILIIGFLLIRDRFLRQRRRYEFEQSLHNKIIDLEQQALKAQMNPHFIFNCLTAVQHFVNQEDMYAANMYLSNFARLIRKTLDLSGEQYIALDEEIAYLSDYIRMENLRFGDKFIYEIQVADDVDTFEIQVPPMLLQPIIENAIRHGLRNREGNDGRLLLSFVIKDSTLYCSVDDNGIGREKARQLKTTMHVEYQSKGMSLTEMRIQAINQISDKKIRMEVKDKYGDNNQPEGTLFILAFEQ